MDGTLSAAHLRSGVTWMGADVGQRLCGAQNEAWSESGIDTYLNGKTEPGAKWQYRYVSGWQMSPAIQPYGVRLWMGFRFDRRDPDWDVDNLELPCPVVTLGPYGQRNKKLPKPPKGWDGPCGGHEPR